MRASTTLENISSGRMPSLSRPAVRTTPFCEVKKGMPRSDGLGDVDPDVHFGRLAHAADDSLVAGHALCKMDVVARHAMQPAGIDD